MAIDIGSLEISNADEPVDVQIRHPSTWQPLGITFHVIRRDTKAGKRAMLQAVRENQKEEGESDDDYGARIETILSAYMVSGWTTDEEDNCVPRNGERLEFSRENALSLLSDPGYFWMAQQVNSVVQSHDIFFGKPTKS